VARLIHDDGILAKFVNIPVLLARVEGDRELVTELLTMFQEELPGLQAALHDAVDAGDLIEVAKTAHTVKGMLANLSMEEGTLLAATIESAAGAGDMPRIRERLIAFDAEIVALSAAVAVFLAGR
jgi:HPt (histidine-containing phosphotransfer) domain-containing protein